MSKTIDPKLKKIGEYLQLEQDARFVVPEYRRRYSWDIERCDKLWTDISDFIDSGDSDNYFFGTAIISCKNNDTILNLIDGQQRTTTFLLLFKAMLININDQIPKISNDPESAPLLSGLSDRRKDIMHILYHIDRDEIYGAPQSEIDSKMIDNAPSIFISKSNDESFRKELSRVLSYATYDDIEENTTKIKYKRDDNRYTNFFKNFKFFYSKLKELSASELNTFAKCVINKCEIIEIRSWQVDQAINMFNSLNSAGLPLSDTDIIASKLYAKASQSHQEEDFNRKYRILKHKIDELENQISLDSILQQYMYILRIQNGDFRSQQGALINNVPGLRKYYTVINERAYNDPIDFTNNLISLVNKWTQTLDFTSTKILFKLDENSKIFLSEFYSRYSDNSLNRTDIELFNECLLRLFAVLKLVRYGYSSKYFKSFLFEHQEKFIDPSISIAEIKNIFDQHINKNWSREEIKNILLDYDNHPLVYLNEYLVAKEMGMAFNLGTKYDIEHILPQSGDNISSIRKDASIDNDEEFAQIVNKLGNKIVLESPINRGVGNSWFRSKLEKYKEKSTDFPMAKILVTKFGDQQKSAWTKDDIKRETNTIADRITKFIFEG